MLARQAGDEVPEQKEFVQQCLAYGRQAYLQRRISSEASIGKLLFANGYRLLDNLGLVAVPEDPAQRGDLGEQRLQIAQTFRQLQRRLERVRAAALP